MKSGKCILSNNLRDFKPSWGFICKICFTSFGRSCLVNTMAHIIGQLGWDTGCSNPWLAIVSGCGWVSAEISIDNRKLKKLNPWGRRLNCLCLAAWARSQSVRVALLSTRPRCTPLLSCLSRLKTFAFLELLCVVYVGVCVCVCFWDRISHCLTGCPVSPVDPPVSAFSSTSVTKDIAIPPFHVGAGGWTQVLMSAWWMLHWLNHFLIFPSTAFYMKLQK